MPGAVTTAQLFPSPSHEGYMSNNTMLYAMYRMGYHGRATVHGFRAMASTVLNEMGFRGDVIERQLAHQDKNAIRAAYNRAEYLSERRAMMIHWGNYVASLSQICKREYAESTARDKSTTPNLDRDLNVLKGTIIS